MNPARCRYVSLPSLSLFTRRSRDPPSENSNIAQGDETSSQNGGGAFLQSLDSPVWHSSIVVFKIWQHKVEGFIFVGLLLELDIRK